MLGHNLARGPASGPVQLPVSWVSRCFKAIEPTYIRPSVSRWVYVLQASRTHLSTFKHTRKHQIEQFCLNLPTLSRPICSDNMAARPEILIFGAGAIGAFYGSRLALSTAQPNVSVVCRSNYSAVNNSGFTIQSPSYGDYTWRPTRVYPNASSATDGTKWDYIVVSTKALPDVSDDSKLLEGLVSDGTAIVLIQNGLGVEKPYAQRFPKAVILSAVTVCSAAQPEHGLIVHNRWTRINSGPYYLPGTAESHDAVQKNDFFNDMLVKANVKDASAYSAEKMQMLRWHKIAINAAMNPSSVLSGGSDNAGMAKDGEMGSHLVAVMDEVLHTARQLLGRDMPAEFATSKQILKSTQRNPSGSVPSMQLDWDGGKTMELEVILGNPIRAARERGLAMPRLEVMYALLKMKQRNREDSKGATKKSRL